MLPHHYLSRVVRTMSVYIYNIYLTRAEVYAQTLVHRPQRLVLGHIFCLPFEANTSCAL